MPTAPTPFLWFDTQAEEAMNFYVSIFPRSKTGAVTRVQGRVMTVEFELDGQEFVALNGGPQFKFTEAVSFVVNCDTQEEVDYYWERLSEGGEKSRCGWLRDKFGLGWQVTPTILGKLLADKDQEKANRVMQTMLKMDKLDIEPLQRAYEES